MSEIIDYISNKLAEIFSIYYQLTGNYGFSIIILSITCSLMIYFLNILFNKYKKKRARNPENN
jgi:hypothetical protein